MGQVEDFLTSEEEAAIIDAIRRAEKNTSGEIRVHIEATSKSPDFDMLHMENTRQRNGVLIYIAVDDRTLVILGDQGINDMVDPFFWESTKDIIIGHFKNGDMKNGLVEGILKAGEQLKKYFPYNKGDKNELSDEISIG